MAEIVYTAVTDATGIHGTLFQGAKFWLSQKVPQRNRFIEEVRANGGEVTPLEKEADVKIVDHARKQQLPGTYSYQYIENSVRNGALEDLEKYVVGPPVGTIRAVGSVIQPAKSGRTKFTTEDDHELIDWVARVEQRGGSTSGNEIYKHLEAKNPRHTWQSWRDRWVKTLRDLPRSAFTSQDAPPTPPADQSVEANRSPRATKQENVSRIPFTQEDAKALLNHGHDIEGLDPDDKQPAWSRWAKNYGHPGDHSAEDWQDLWERTIRPIFLKQASQWVQEPAVNHGSMDADVEPHGNPEEQEQASSPVRIPPTNEAAKESTVPRSPSFHPESPTRQYQVPVLDRGPTSSVINLTDGANDALHGSRSPTKRKRPVSEDEEEVPSSSPPQPAVSRKRLRRDSVRPEILPSPEKASPRDTAKEIPDTYATDKPGAPAVIVISDENDSPSCDEEDRYSEASHSLSPELGSSPKQMFSNSDHKMSRTQAAFLESAPPIDLEIPAPDEGWPDEDEDERDDKSNSDEDREPELAEEEAALFDLPAPDGGWPDEDAEDNSQGSADERTEYDRILEEEGGGVYEGEDEVEDGVVVDLDSQIDEITGTESSMHTQEKIVAKAMGMRAGSPSTTVRSPSPAPAPAGFQPTAPGPDLTTQTPEPDLFLSEPEGGWANILSSPPVSPSAANQPQATKQQQQQQKQQQQAPQDPEPDHAANLDAFISYLLAQNHNEDDILLALRCTNFDHQLTEKVLVYMKSHPGEIPPDMRGCWTERDDGSLRGNNASEIRMLEEKHGKESLEVRWRVLECYTS